LLGVEPLAKHAEEEEEEEDEEEDEEEEEEEEEEDEEEVVVVVVVSLTLPRICIPVQKNNPPLLPSIRINHAFSLPFPPPPQRSRPVLCCSSRRDAITKRATHETKPLNHDPAPNLHTLNINSAFPPPPPPSPPQPFARRVQLPPH
jgi:hypothetical protein